MCQSGLNLVLCESNVWVRAVDLEGIDRIESSVEAVCLPGPNLVLCERHLFQNDCLPTELF